MASSPQVRAGQRPERRDGRPVYDSYARLSWNPTTRELEKIEDQLKDNRTVVERLGGVVGEELSDGLSAWKRNVRRPGWVRLLERVKAGESDGIVVWHTDRLFRQPRDLESLIDLGDRGFLVASAHGTRDLADPDDRFILRIEVAHAARSSDDTSRRIKRRFETLRSNGELTGGPRAFGFPGYVPVLKSRADGAEDLSDRIMVPDEQVTRERQAIRDGSDALLAGRPYSKIAADWNAAGLRTVYGYKWSGVTVRDVLSRPINAGFVEHDGVPVGRMPGEPIVDAETFERVQAIRAGRRRGRVAGERHLGSGILRCGHCGRALTGKIYPIANSYADGTRRKVYHCPVIAHGCGRVAVTAREVDRELRALVVERLSDPEHAAQMSEYSTQRSERLTKVRQDIAQCEQLAEALSERLGRMEMTLAAFDKANKPLAARLAALTAERKSLESGSLGPLNVATEDEIEAEWEAADIEGKRTMVRRALGRFSVIVKPARRKGGNKFDRSRVGLVPPDWSPPAPQS
ncbi:MAG TPA: recombinase family protein [Pseudonocardiaceae bacterium]|nr:recombinase family protein [Pseudonocardiaceae bacterium]